MFFAPHRACGVVALFSAAVGSAAAQTAPPGSEYQIYSGNTHAHTQYTWSHGAQYSHAPAEPGEGKKGKSGGLRISPEGAQSPPEGLLPRPDWQKYQGPPAAHYAIAKKGGYDFYATSDHSQEAPLNPVGPANPAWVASRREAAEATDARFVAMAGFEYSENNGPGGKGHLNVYNSREYLNALAPGRDLPYFYNWLKTARPDGDGPVVASFNHPGADQYNNWADCDPQVADVLTLFEVINSNTKIHYEAFLNALDKGWKVSPVCGNDNHGLGGITQHTSRTFVLATAKTKAAILDAMKNRRTYASLEGNLQCRYAVNGALMGSTLARPDTFKFEIWISDPDTTNPQNKITRIDIVTTGGAVVQEHRPEPAHAVTWSPTIRDTTSRYFFVRVWNEGGGDAAKGDPGKPVAWLAPVWTGR
jgi:hypothetical protein